MCSFNKSFKKAIFLTGTSILTLTYVYCWDINCFVLTYNEHGKACQVIALADDSVIT